MNRTMRTVAGVLTLVVVGVLALPAEAVPADTRRSWQSLRDALPPLPTKREGDKTLLLPAEEFQPRRTNSENPEIYAIYPFRLFGVGKPNIEVARETLARRRARATSGWQQTGMVAAICGSAGEARDVLIANVRNSNPGHRFPVMWGPNYDWVPDQDHGSNFMHTLQLMVLQSDGGKIHAFPAWPAQWNVRFRLHAPGNTIVEGACRNGRAELTTVSPDRRRADVTIHRPQ
jgi:hypothetical protein